MEAIDLTKLTKLTCPICGNVWYEEGIEEFPNNVVCNNHDIYDIGSIHIDPKSQMYRVLENFKINIDGNDTIIKGVRTDIAGKSFLRFVERLDDLPKSPVVTIDSMYGNTSPFTCGHVRLFQINFEEYQIINNCNVFEKIPKEFPFFDDFPDLKEKLSKLKLSKLNLNQETVFGSRFLENHRVESPDGKHYQYDFYIFGIMCNMTEECRYSIIYPEPTSGYNKDGVFYHSNPKRIPRNSIGYHIRISDIDYSIEKILE